MSAVPMSNSNGALRSLRVNVQAIRSALKAARLEFREARCASLFAHQPAVQSRLEEVRARRTSGEVVKPDPPDLLERRLRNL